MKIGQCSLNAASGPQGLQFAGKTYLVPLMPFLVFLLNSCASIAGGSIFHWEEEVRLTDGRTLLLSRSVTLEVGGPLVEKETIRFQGTGGVVEFESCAAPVAFDYVNGSDYVVVTPAFSPCPQQLDLDHSGLAAYKYDNLKWTRLKFADAPQSLRGNLVANWKEAIKDSPVQTGAKTGERHVSRIGWCAALWQKNGNRSSCSAKDWR